MSRYQEEAKCSSAIAVPNVPVADEIMNYADSLLERIIRLNDRVYDKLRSVMVEDYPRESTEERKLREYPPLFNDLRNKFDSIKNNIVFIENALDRTEL